MALHKLWQKNPEAIVDIKDRARKALSDRDYGVVGASLSVFHDLILVFALVIKSALLLCFVRLYFLNHMISLPK